MWCGQSRLMQNVSLIGHKILMISIGFAGSGLFQSCANDSNPAPPAIGNKSIGADSSLSDEDKADPKTLKKSLNKEGTHGGDSEDLRAAGENEAGMGDASKASFDVFHEKVYPLMVEWCAACHKADASQAVLPYLADINPKKAFDGIIAGHKVDFKDPLLSRIYLKIVDEKHNCPSPEACIDRGKLLGPPLEEWSVAARGQGAVVSDSDPKRTTSAKLIGEAASTRSDSGVPDGSFYWPAESGTLKLPFMIKDNMGAEGGKTITTAPGAVDQTNLNTATNDASLGTVIFNVDIKTPGVYHLVGRVTTPNATVGSNSSFYIRTDANPFVVWDFPGLNNVFSYDKADAVPAVGPPHAFNLTAGPHTIEIRQRQAGLELDSIILTPNLTFDFTSFATAVRKFAQMEFDLSPQTGIPGSLFSMDIAELDEKTYLVRNPKVTLSQGSVTIKGVKVLLNGKFDPKYATFLGINETVAAPGKILSTSGLTVIKVKGPEMDKFSVTFDVVEKAP